MVIVGVRISKNDEGNSDEGSNPVGSVGDVGTWFMSCGSLWNGLRLESNEGLSAAWGRSSITMPSPEPVLPIRSPLLGTRSISPNESPKPLAEGNGIAIGIACCGFWGISFGKLRATSTGIGSVFTGVPDISENISGALALS